MCKFTTKQDGTGRRNENGEIGAYLFGEGKEFLAGTTERGQAKLQAGGGHCFRDLSVKHDHLMR